MDPLAPPDGAALVGPRMAALLERHHEEMRSAWAAKLRSLGTTPYARRSSEEIQAWTQTGLSALIDTLKTGSTGHLSDYVDSLSEARRRQGFAIEDVIESLLLLREAVVQTLLERVHATSELQRGLLRFEACHRALLTRFAARYAEGAMHKLRQEKDRTELMLRTAELVGGTLELEVMLPRIAEQLAAALNAAYCGIYLWNDTRDLLELRAAVGGDPELGRLLEGQLQSTEALIVDTRSSRRAVVCRSSDPHCLFDARSDANHGVSTSVAVPILLGDRPVALAITLHAEDQPGPGADRVQLAEGLAQSVAPAIENALQYARVRREVIEAQRLQGATSCLLDMQSLDDVLEIICRAARELAKSTGSAILLHRERDGRAQFCGQGSATGRAEELRDRSKAGDPSLLTFPLRVKHDRLGTLLLVTPDGVTEEDMRVLNRFTEQAATALAHGFLHEQDERLAALEERQRLARELHDSVTQSLYGTAMFSETAARLLESDDRTGATRVLEELQQTALAALREMRLLIFELRPSVLETEGLVSALEARLAAVEKRAGIETNFRAEDIGDLPQATEELLYGIAQETMNNILKHASASKIRLLLSRQPGAVILEIADDGVGFDRAHAPRSGGLGLLGMKERAAKAGADLTIVTRPGTGTCVKLRVPVFHP